ncbi:TadE family protein [Microbacterium immunditiarum]|uniref:TadE family protein n=1 Tax=Microbacterium immunditiarum TaxID=337480 RepID=A0A7Y9GP01_9MICO|nr:TadE family protein [Microbacterium immunditiarum]NYE19981.1 hypothetical protein [Microbacterium immunditiarum]
MRPSSPSTDVSEDPPERGSAPLEFILVGLLMLVPIVYLIVALGLIQSQALGAKAGARHLARTVATAGGVADADRRAERVLESVTTEYGLDPSTVAVDVECSPAGGACPRAGAMLHVTISTRVSLPLVPPVLGLERIASIPIEASAVQKVSRTWGDGT